ncbi:MAG: iron ABC transporter permease [Spirochaetaceae bacterium]|jgi:iron complex transport system permease protein|nr:iron ABC transporter permease [Spirochaetaceae bacterium]
MKNSRRIKRRIPHLVFPVIGVMLMAALFVFSLALGQYTISFDDTLKALWGNASSATDGVVIWELRFPRTAVACFVGVALALSGLIYQSAFQNELVSPDILGVSSGASVGVATGILLDFPLLSVSGFGFIFGAGAMLLTLLIARVFKNKSSIILVISGILVSGLMGSIVSLIKAWANAETVLPSIVFWLLGSFAAARMIHVWILLPIVVICAVFLFMISGKALNNIALGQEEAKSKGINYKVWRIVIIVIGTILTASAVSVAGTIGWVGLVVPHITRLLVGHTAQKTIPVTVVLGGSFMIITDILARTLTTSEIPVGAITGIIGIVVFMLILATQRGRNYVID